MSKERLEEIKYNWYKTTWGIDKSDVQWLIEQAERAHDLEVQIHGHKYHINKLEKQHKRYREAIDYVTSAKLDQYRNAENMLNDFKYVINKTLERESE